MKALSVDRAMKAVSLLSLNTKRNVFFVSFVVEEDCFANLKGMVRYRKRCVHLGKHPLAVFGSSIYAVITDLKVAQAAFSMTFVNCSDSFFTDRSRSWRYILRKFSISVASDVW
jgi:hypothetical protein